MFRAARGASPGVLRSLHGRARSWAGSSGSSLAAQATPTADSTATVQRAHDEPADHLTPNLPLHLTLLSRAAGLKLKLDPSLGAQRGVA